jgi:hypothetical protein
VTQWRAISARIVYDVLERTKGQTPAEIRKALKEAYPFGERAMHPYKVWLDEIRRQTKGKLSTRKPKDIVPFWERGKGETDERTENSRADVPND